MLLPPIRTVFSKCRQQKRREVYHTAATTLVLVRAVASCSCGSVVHRALINCPVLQVHSSLSAPRLSLLSCLPCPSCLPLQPKDWNPMGVNWTNSSLEGMLGPNSQSGFSRHHAFNVVMNQIECCLQKFSRAGSVCSLLSPPHLPQLSGEK